jgi:hypothetical protein
MQTDQDGLSHHLLDPIQSEGAIDDIDYKADADHVAVGATPIRAVAIGLVIAAPIWILLTRLLLWTFRR